MVDAMLLIWRTGCQWRYLPTRLRHLDGGLGALVALRANGVWEHAINAARGYRPDPP